MAITTITEVGALTQDIVDQLNDNFSELSGTSAGGALADGHILVGSALGVSTDVAMSGDVTILNTGATDIAASVTLTTPVLSGTVTGTYTLGGTPTLASAAGVPYAAGVAAGYKVARGITALDGSNPTNIATGLASVLGFSGTINNTAGVDSGTAFVTYGTISGGTVPVYGWVQAGTASTGTENIAWVAVGT